MTDEQPTNEQPTDDDLLDPAQQAHLALETYHVVVYFAAEPREAFAALGLHGRAGYFASRAAAMGAVGPEAVGAIFAVFNPEFVREQMAGTWTVVTPAQMVSTRREAVGATLHRALGDRDVSEALELAREATTVLEPQGRPLYAAHAALTWPQHPMLALWHAATLLREHRGDGHVAAMTLAGLHPIEAMILHGHATGTTPFLQQTRGWTEQQWQAAVQRLHDRGLLSVENGQEVVTEAGRSAKSALEDATRRAAVTPWRHLGREGTERLVELMTPLRQDLVAGDIFPVGSPLKPH